MEQLELFKVKNNKTKSKNKRRCKVCKVVKVLDRDFLIASTTIDNKFYKKTCRACGALNSLVSSQIRKDNLNRYPADGVCELCKKTSPWILNCDHCHKNKSFRGWICRECNLGLGFLGDTKKSIKRALRYLERSLNEH